MKTFLTSSLLFVVCTFLSTQDVKKIAAHRISENIRLDGQLNEAAWQAAPAATDFITLRPTPGLAPAQKTVVKILYDDAGLYVGAFLYDQSPDSITAELTERDQIGNTDFFGVVIDPYQSGQNGFEFITTPGNVQFDASVTTTNGEDTDWDAVWKSKAQMTPDGWRVEMFIPYSAIRFPKTQEQEWFINFFRRVGRSQEQGFWSEVDPEVDGFLNQSGLLTGVRDIKSPFRLQLTPFATAAGAKSSDPSADPQVAYGSTFGGGMDLKLGLSDAFTLDMTLIPDFSEARSDDNILNLGPFEQRFDEQRAFFTEGTELFSKGNFFYSRRIGGNPYYSGAADDVLQEGEAVIERPSRAKLLNATKISGRTKSGLGIGFFNAIEQRTYATIGREQAAAPDVNPATREVLIHPRANYNVLVLDQNLPNNSSVTLVNTSVLREGEATDANVTGLVFDLHNKANAYSISGKGGYSQRLTDGENSTGHVLQINAGKISGNWNWRVGYSEESDTYNPNDLGILFNNNERRYWGNLRYNRFKPFLNGYFLSGGAGIYVAQERLYADNKFGSNNIEAWVYARNK
ncbi:MAG: DUF5916 domain-containing protein, partial [Bacteroidota bacterium]